MKGLTRMLLPAVVLVASACAGTTRPGTDASGNRVLAAELDSTRRGAEAGDSDAQNALGRWYLTAAARGSETQPAPGAKYAIGDGVPPDPVQAAYWLRKAAEQGEVQALEELGMLYADGFGTRQDYVIAYELLQLSGQRAGPGNNPTKIAFERNVITPCLNAAQVAEAQAGAREWKPGAALPDASHTWSEAAPHKGCAERWSQATRITIQRNWQPPADAAGRSAVVGATLDTDGMVQTVNLRAGSGSDAFDLAALAAVNAAHRLPRRFASAVQNAADFCFSVDERPCAGETDAFHVAGPRSMLTVQRGFDGNQAAIWAAYSKAMRPDSPAARLQVEMQLVLVIEPDGHVSSCEVRSSNVKAPELEAAVAQAVRGINFGAWTGAPFQTLYPVTFAAVRP